MLPVSRVTTAVYYCNVWLDRPVEDSVPML